MTVELALGIAQTALLAEIARRQGSNRSDIDNNSEKIARNREQIQEVA